VKTHRCAELSSNLKVPRPWPLLLSLLCACSPGPFMGLPSLSWVCKLLWCPAQPETAEGPEKMPHWTRSKGSLALSVRTQPDHGRPADVPPTPAIQAEYILHWVPQGPQRQMGLGGPHSGVGRRGRSSLVRDPYLATPLGRPLDTWTVSKAGGPFPTQQQLPQRGDQESCKAQVAASQGLEGQAAGVSELHLWGPEPNGNG
jgi:hypothetical protein